MSEQIVSHADQIEALLPEGRPLHADEQYQVPGFADTLPEPEESTTIPIAENASVTGIERTIVRIGGAETHSNIRIIDTHLNPQVREATRPDGTKVPVRQVGQKADGSSLSLAGDFIVVIPSGDDRPPVTRALVAGMPLRIGRGEGMVGGDLLPDTVSREHCEISISEDGTLQIENLNPTNETRVFTANTKGASSHEPVTAAPSPQPAAEARPRSGETISDERAAELLSYSDVLSDYPDFGNYPRTDAIEWTKNSPSGQKYMTELKTMVETYGTARLMGYADAMRARCRDELRHLGVLPSIHGESLSWALWDMAKQSYLAKHPEESTADYTEQAETALADPLDFDWAAGTKRDEIVARHVGWEVARHYDRNKPPERPAEALAMDNRYFPPAMLQLMGIEDPKAMHHLLENGERNETGQRRSFVLHQIGVQAMKRSAAVRR